MITLRDATVTYGHNDRPALDGVSLRVERGDWIGVVGDNGSGKTTLLAAIAGVTPLARGARESHPEVRTALLLQEPDNQFVATTVRHELALSVPADVAERARGVRVTEAIARFELDRLLDRNPHRLSGGEKQRLACATVWLEDPHVLLLDEPLAYLDAAARARVVGFVREMNARGVAVVWTTPDEDDLALARRVVTLDHGRLRDGEARPPSDANPQRAIDNRARGPERERQVVSPHRGLAAFDDPVVRFESVAFAYHDVPVFNSVDLAVMAGECLGVAGANGAGKSTLLLLAGGALFPTRGRVERRAAGAGGDGVLYLPQNPERLFFAESVRDEIAFGLRRRGLSHEDASSRSDDALRAVGLDPAVFAERSPFQLSAGEMRRVALAIAESLAPQLLLLDEPSSALDTAGRRVLARLVAARTAAGAAAVLASHDSKDLVGICDHLVTIENGRALPAMPAPSRSSD
jgi:energy-coupling factor transport system ATP-binding protein